MNIYTGQQFETRDSAETVTSHIVTVEDRIHGDSAPRWVDGPGWSDSQGDSDIHTFKHILAHLQRSHLTHVKAVVWCVFPTPRMDSLLQEQAQYIASLTESGVAGRERREEGVIWNNVVVVCKGRVARDLNTDVKGAKMAAFTYNVDAEIQAVRYDLDPLEDLPGKPDKEYARDVLCYLTKEEVREKLQEMFGKLPPAVQVVFSPERCCVCGQVGDPRLLSPVCHSHQTRGHLGHLIQRFSKTSMYVSLVLGSIATITFTSLTTILLLSGVGIMACIPLLAIPPTLGPGLVIAGHRLLNCRESEGNSVWVVRDMRWSCCRQREREEGCVEVCQKCGKKWGQGPGCVLIRQPEGDEGWGQEYEVQIKDHMLSPVSPHPQDDPDSKQQQEDIHNAEIIG